MKKFDFMAIAAGLLILSSPAALLADDTSDTKSADKPNAELREKLRNMTSEERHQWAKEHPAEAKKFQQQIARASIEKNRGVLERAGLNPDEIKDLPPAERHAKLKGAVDARVADLEKKKSGGPLTEQEQSDLDSLNQIKGMLDHQGQHHGGHPSKGSKRSTGDLK
jgi:iron uptake system EfeUOB component EfeO/EfeM